MCEISQIQRDQKSFLVKVRSQQEIKEHADLLAAIITSEISL